MNNKSDKKIVLIKKKTRLDELVARFNTAKQAEFYIKHLGADFSDYLNENKIYNQAIDNAVSMLGDFGYVQVLERAYIPNFLFSKDDIIVVIGPDGLVVNALKYIPQNPVIAVNPDPARFDGILLPFNINDLNKIVPEVIDNKRKTKDITIAKANLSDGQTLYAVNDFFVGQRSHISARYQIISGGINERQSSSGVIISTGLGATGWLTSVINGVSEIAGNLLNKKLDLKVDKSFNWDSEYLYFSVREPFPGKNLKASLVFGKITKDEPLMILSEMSENGVIFSDGIESDFLEFSSGLKALITIADEKGKLIV